MESAVPNDLCLATIHTWICILGRERTQKSTTQLNAGTPKYFFIPS